MKKLLMLLSALLVTTSTLTANAAFTPNVTNDYYSTTANGIPTPNTSGTSWDLFNAVNLLTGSTYTKNEDIDSLYKGTDKLWKAYSNADQISVAVIGYSAKNTNNLGYYTGPSGSDMHSLLTGVSGFGFTGDNTSNDPFISVEFNNPGNIFGWYFNSVNWLDPSIQYNYFSENVANTDKYNHMITYQLWKNPEFRGKTIYLDSGPITIGQDTFLVGWEDRLYSSTTKTAGDEDYNDLIMLIDFATTAGGTNHILTEPPNIINSVVPEPGTVVLVGAGLAGLVLVGRRKRN